MSNPGDAGAEGRREARQVRAEGARLANEVADRFSDGQGATSLSPETKPVEHDTFAFRDLRAELDRALDANIQVLRMLIDVSADVAERAWKSSGLGERLQMTGEDDEVLRLPPVLAGRTASSTLWLHNTTTTAAGPLTLVATPLIGRLGGFITPDAVALEPDTVAGLAAGASSPIAIEVSVAPDATPDRYEGRIVIPELPDDPLLVTIDVVAAG